MSNVTAPTDPQAELRAALKALADFDSSTLVNEDGSPNEAAQAALKRLQQRVDAAVAQAATA